MFVTSEKNNELEEQQQDSGAKHFPLFSQRPFQIRIHLIVLWHPFLVFIQTQYIACFKTTQHLNMFTINPEN